MTVASPGLSFNGNHANITIELIIHDAQPTLNSHRNATPCDNMVQGAEPKSERSNNASPNPMTLKDKSSMLNDFGSNAQRDFAAQGVCGRTCAFFINL
jgi:hypothetical protein